MKKYALIAAFLLALLLFGCTQQEVFVYHLEEGDVRYELTINESDKTFVLVETNQGEVHEYSGKYEENGGVYVLSAELFGYRSVYFVGDEFRFVSNPEGKEEIPLPCDHVWDGGVRTEGTCVEYGYTLYTCTKCGETRTEKDTAYGDHLSDGGKHLEGATCTDHGFTVYTCKYCKKELNRVEDEGYTENHSYVITDAAALDEGCLKYLKRLYRCERCGAEKYFEDDSHAIGAHRDENKDGVCDVCKRLSNGLSTVHQFKVENGREVCKTCGVAKSVLEGCIASPDGYTENGIAYIGVYPQTLAPQEAKNIVANGRYDSALDCWYYGNEAYVVRTVTREGVLGPYTFDRVETKAVRGETFAFLLQPLAFVQRADGAYVSEKIVDAACFMSEYAVINKEGESSDWEESTLRVYLASMADRIGTDMEIDLPTAADAAGKSMTDYALAGGMDRSAEGTGMWWLKTAADESKVDCVGYDGKIAPSPVTVVRGIVPVLSEKEGEE